MSNLSWTSIVLDGALLSAALGTVIVGSLAYNARLWIQGAPPRVRAQAPPLTPAEQRARLVVAALMLLTLIGVTAWSAARLLARSPDALPFGMALAHFAGVFFLFNLADLLVIDWFILLVVRPAFVRRLSVPGLSYEETVGGVGHHFRGFVKGFAFVGAASLIAGTITYVAG